MLKVLSQRVVALIRVITGRHRLNADDRAFVKLYTIAYPRVARSPPTAAFNRRRVRPSAE
jgi:hypothetical protein